MNTIDGFDGFMPPQRSRQKGEARSDAHTVEGELHPIADQRPSGSVPVGERPIILPEQDLLDRNGMAKRLAMMLAAPNNTAAQRMTVGITGDWGVGKTSMLNLLEFELGERRPRPIVVRFEPWLATGRGTLIPDFFSALATVLGKERRYKEQVARAVDLLRAFARSFMSTQPANLIPPQAVKAGIDSAPSFTGQRANLADILAKIDLPIIVLVDDVDSLDATDLRALMQLIRGLCDFERLSFVLAYDEGRLTDNLSFGLPAGSADIRARAHLEKLVQMQIPLPQVNRARLQTLLETELYNFFGDDEASAKERMSGDIRFQELAGSMLPGDILSTPRDIKRVTGHTKALATVLQGRVDPIDILGFCALSAKAPSQVADIAIFPEKYSVGPIDGQVANRAGFDDLDSEISGLVRFLFPQDISPQILEKLPKNRICFDEALQAVLQFGVDADLPEISDIEDLPDPDPIADLLPAGSTEIARQLTGAAERGEAVAFLTQVSAAYLPADVEVDEQLWRGLLRGLKFVQADASRQSAETGDVVARIAQMFEDRAAAQPGFHAVDILSTLINGQEWNVSARILRPYWGAEEKPSNSQALEGDDAHNLAFQYALQAKTAHAHNVFLPHLTSIAPILLLIALDVWDHEWRSGLQEALINETAETSARLLDLLFAPDIEIEQTVRHQIIGSDQIVSHLAQLWARRARKKSSNPA